jgi:hypothetical protein
MSLQLQITKHQLVDLKQIAQLGPERLLHAQVAIRGIAPPLRPQQLLNAIQTVLDPANAEPLARQLLALQGIARRSGQSIDDVSAALRSALIREGSEGGIGIEDWLTVEDMVKQLAAEPNVRIAAKAIELAYDYANLLRQTKILTDIRPLYNDAADDIEAAVVSYTMRLRYDSADGEHELSVTAQ